MGWNNVRGREFKFICMCMMCPHISLEGKLPNGIQSAVFDATCVFLERERKREGGYK